MKKVSFKKELVKKRNGGLWVEVTYLVNDEVVMDDHYNLSNSPKFINDMIEKDRLNIELNLNDLN